MQVLKKDKDGTAVADRPIFILETEETMLGYCKYISSFTYFALNQKE